MREKIQTLLLLSLLSPVTLGAEATILKVSKTVNPKNVLHYKVKYDADTCELSSGVYGEWKMDEEDGHWKPLSESMSMIRAPLEPKMRTQTVYEAEFVTDSMSDFQNKKILATDRIRVKIEDKEGKCVISNEVDLRGQTVQVNQLHSKLTMLGNVRWVQIISEKPNGDIVNVGYDKRGNRIKDLDPKEEFLPVN
jgi:lipopolysaccharide assembly outer membrane protein LptD (OstA)